MEVYYFIGRTQLRIRAKHEALDPSREVVCGTLFGVAKQLTTCGGSQMVSGQYMMSTT